MICAAGTVAAMQHTGCPGPRGTQIRLSTFVLRARQSLRSLRVMPQEKTPPTMLCPACKTRMSTRQIATASFNKFVYHCPMCDTEIKQEGALLWRAPLHAST